MLWTILRRSGAVTRTLTLSLFLAWAPLGCGALDVADPTAIEEGDVSNAFGAELLRGSALKRLSVAMADGAFYSGLLADEFLSDAPSAFPDELLDRRASVRFEEAAEISAAGYREWQALRLAASAALPKLREFAPSGAEAHVGEMYGVRAFAALRLAEDVCPGFPLHDLVDSRVVYGAPLSTEEALERALADYDSAASWAVDSARILNFVRVGRARTLLNLGRYDDAASAAGDVPTGYVYQAEYGSAAGHSNTLAIDNFFWLVRWRSVADSEGGTGLDFVSASDPRVQTTPLGLASDGVTDMYGIAKYPNQDTPVVIASGIEARLIEAEVALQAGEPSWLTTLNDLRANQITPSLAPLSDPGTAEARLDLLFRERAFWLFGTGNRLADLRRLIRLYGRTSESVFPTGAYRRGGEYEAGTSIPFPAVSETPYNAAVTGCTSR